MSAAAFPDVFTDLVATQRSFLRDVVVAAAWDLGLTDLPERARRILCDVLRLEGLEGLALPAHRPSLPDTGLGALAQVIRSGIPLDVGPDQTAYHAHLLSLAPAPGALLSAWLHARGVRHLADLGGGHGGYTEAWLGADPTHTATLVDAAPIAAAASERLSAHARRLHCIGGDLLATSHVEADAALLCNVLHLLDPVSAATTVHQAARSVRPGGWVVVKDLHVDAAHAGTLEGLYFAVTMLAYTAGGDAHDEPTLRHWMADAGLEDVAVIPPWPVAGSITLVGVRPA